MNALDIMVRDWEALRRALESAALTMHELHGGAGVRLAECPEPECVYRSGLLDRTGGSAPDA